MDGPTKIAIVSIVWLILQAQDTWKQHCWQLRLLGFIDLVLPIRRFALSLGRF